MIFVRFKGPSIGPGRFSEGKVYFARPEVNAGNTLGLDELEVVDDEDSRIRMDPDKGLFEFLDEVFAVIVHPFDEYEVGEVVILDEIGTDGDFIRVKGTGYRQVSDVSILDRTTLYPGVCVMELATGRWHEVSSVDECMWLTIKGADRGRAPTEFRFLVSGGDIQMEPIVECIDDTGSEWLKAGHFYRLVQMDWDEGTVLILNESGQEEEFLASRFNFSW